MKDWQKICIAGIVLYLVLAMYFGSLNFTDWKLAAAPTSPYTPTAPVAGIFDMKTKGYNSLDITSVLAENTNYHLYWYANRGGWIMLGKGDAAIEVTEADMGCVYAVVKVPAGQSYYVDSGETRSKNPRVQAVNFEDVDNDGYKDFAFKFSMANIPKPATGNPTVYFYPYFLAYEQPQLNAPADITGIGGARSTQYIEWYLYFSNPCRAWAVTRVEITINTTDTTKVTLKNVNVPGYGYVSGDAFGTPLRGVNTLTWTLTIGSNFQDAAYIKYGVNQLNKFDSTVAADVQLSSGDKIQVTITYYGLTTTGTIQTRSDSVVLRHS